MKLNQIVLAFATWGLAAGALADDALELQEVKVVGKRLVNERGYKAERSEITGINTSILDTPFSIDVVTQQQLQDKQPKTLEEAVSGISGLTQGNNLAGTLDAVMRRGYGGNRDGSVLRNGAASTAARNFTATAQRVEVLKGPASVLYGLQNPGGVINVVSKTPDHQQAQHTLSGSFGSEKWLQAGVDTTGPIGTDGLAYRLVADYRQQDYWRSFGRTREAVIAPSLAWKNRRSSLLAAYEYQKYEAPFDRGTFTDTNETVNGRSNPHYGKPLNIPFTRRLDDPINVTRGYSHHFRLSGSHRFPSSWKLSAQYAYSRNHYNDWQTRIMRYNAADAAKAEVRRRIDGTRPSDAAAHSLNLSADGFVEQRDGLIGHKLRAALELQDYRLRIGDLRRSAKQHGMSIERPQYGADWVADSQPVADERTSNMLEHYRTASLLLQDSAYFGERWIVAGGLRGQYHQIRSGQGRGSLKFRNRDQGFTVLPQLGAVFLITPAWSVYGNAGLSAKPNPSRSWNYQGAKIPLEKSRQFEIGSKYNGENLSANLALFAIRKRDTAKRYTDESGQQIIRIAGRDRSQGVELDINGKITPKLTVSANYTFTDTKVLQDKAQPLNEGTAFDSIPKHTAGLMLVYDFGRLAGGNWRLGAGADYRGSWGFNYVSGKQAHWFRLPAATTYRAFVSYDTKWGGRDVNLRLSGTNLGNKKYAVSHTTATMEHLSLAAPREIRFSAQYRF